MASNRYSATPVRHVRVIPTPHAIPEGTSDHIAASIRRKQLEDEQARILQTICAELGIDPRRERRHRQKAAVRYTVHAKRRARLSEGESFTRAEIIQRDNRACYLCHRTNLGDLEIHLDHDIPLSRGGQHTRANVHVACSRCNLAKGTMTSSEYRATLRKRSR